MSTWREENDVTTMLPSLIQASLFFRYGCIAILGMPIRANIHAVWEWTAGCCPVRGCRTCDSTDAEEGAGRLQVKVWRRRKAAKVSNKCQRELLSIHSHFQNVTPGKCNTWKMQHHIAQNDVLQRDYNSCLGAVACQCLYYFHCL